MKAFADIGNAIDDFGSKKHEENSFFYHFEPWNVEPRPEWVIQQALSDNVNLRDPEFTKFAGADPHPFQTGYLFSEKKFRSIIAGNQLGKSIVDLIEDIILLTGEVPISLRHPKGFDTGVKRMVNKLNIQRFGRCDVRTGKVIDHSTKAEKTPEWDCGTIKGAGVFPLHRVADPGSRIWIGTYMRARDQYWWPRFFDPKKSIIPSHLIDRSRGNEGFDTKNYVVYLIRNTEINMLTYEQGYNRFEAESKYVIRKVTLDEEPEDERVLQSAQQRCPQLSLIETPILGVTWSKKFILPEKPNPNLDIFHATQYDSPYQLQSDIEALRDNMEAWDIGARVYGIPTEQTGKPYYDRTRLNLWISKFKESGKLVRFVPQEEYFRMVDSPDISTLPGLMSVGVKMVEAGEDDRRSTWRIYEEPNPRMAYICSADPAEGGETPDAASDMCAARIMRPPEEKRGEKRPVTVASIRSTLETTQFARVVAHACRVFNNCLLAAETQRHAVNAMFASELRDYPYWYRFVTLNDKSQKPKQHFGFDTSASTRHALFDLIGDYIREVEDDLHGIPDLDLLKELAACVKGKNGRPDHPRDGTLDSAIPFGVILYVIKNSPDQITNNREEDEDALEPFSKLTKLMGRTQSTAPVGLGEDVPKWR